MATGQTSTTTPAGPDLTDPKQLQAAVAAAVAAANSSSSVQQPIGVPFYNIDPQTGQPYNDGMHDPRWAAYVPAPANGPGSFGTQGPGTAPSSGYVRVAPQYFDGAEWIPAQLSPADVAVLQRKMVAAGLLNAGQAQLGVWDVPSMQAYKQLLAYANASGLDAGTAMDRWRAAHDADPNAGRQPLTKQVTSLDELRPAIRKAFIDTLGVGISQDQIDQLARQYQGMQSGAQQQAYDTALSGGTVTQPPDVGSFAEAQARAENPTGAQEHDLIKPGGPLDAFRSILAGWSN